MGILHLNSGLQGESDTPILVPSWALHPEAPNLLPL